jgi:UDP-galactopyranose mutase
MNFPVYIIGSGFFGATLAERITAVYGLPVAIIEKRSHIGGNCWSETYPGTDIEYHRYGSHIFHTSSQHVWDYLNTFTRFNSYQHKVYTTYRDRVYTMPINLETINSYYGINLKPWQVDGFLEKEKEHISDPKNFEEKAISLIGRPLYEAFIRGYSIKQWEKDPRELSAAIISRLPVRNSYNNRYFSDTYEGIPVDGYGRIFEKMLSSEHITIQKNTSFREIQSSIPEDALVVYTGAIDEFFDYQLGRLEWRTVDFEYEIFDLPDYQGTSVMNYADEAIPFTRMHEFKHFHPERPATDNTLVAREYSRFAAPKDEPYYPVNTPRNMDLLRKYQELGAAEPRVVFGGRLGEYRYMDMDVTIASALACFERITARLAAFN